LKDKDIGFIVTFFG